MPGTKVKVDGYQAKDGTHRANGRDLTFADGKKLFMGSSGTGAPYELARPASTRPTTQVSEPVSSPRGPAVSFEGIRSFFLA